MARQPRLTLSTAMVLHGLARGLRYGFELIEATGLQAGTMYPILRRLEDAGSIVGSWEPVAVSRAEGRPPRRYYRLTASGEEMLAAARGRFPGAERALNVEDASAPNPSPRRA